ncbi:hypothetical protein SLEP1_g50035 [Rubroshorea leprosula]|uniref:Bulb-type lectin domain-containing protein n=1 Tax=Rubroshorea leprosula TaxID=152421 RepID=A0AAV5M022_9ROSI|nr:hypothetical protein SLEP1_g50035 [Rubroshorea leprosula]
MMSSLAIVWNPLLILLTSFFLLAAAQEGSRNVNVGDVLHADDRTLTWKSPSDDFELGFHRAPDQQDRFLLAIWFANIPEKTIVWSANGENPVEIESRVELTSNGLVLIAPSGMEFWWSNICNVEVKLERFPVSSMAAWDTPPVPSWVLLDHQSSMPEVALSTRPLEQGGIDLVDLKHGETQAQNHRMVIAITKKLVRKMSNGFRKRAKDEIMAWHCIMGHLLLQMNFVGKAIYKLKFQFNTRSGVMAAVSALPPNPPPSIEESDSLERSTKRVKDDIPHSPLPISNVDSIAPEVAPPTQKNFKDTLIDGCSEHTPPVVTLDELMAVGCKVSTQTPMVADDVSGTPKKPIPKAFILKEIWQKFCVPWKNSLIIKLLGKRINYHMLCARLSSEWRTKGEFEVIDIGNGYYVSKFSSSEDCSRILIGGPYKFFDHYLAPPNGAATIQANPTTKSSEKNRDVPDLGDNFMAYGSWMVAKRKPRKVAKKQELSVNGASSTPNGSRRDNDGKVFQSSNKSKPVNRELGVASNRFAIIAEVEESSGVIPNLKEADSGRKKDKTKKVLGPVVKPSKPSRSKSLDSALIRKSISDKPKQLLCVAASPPISLPYPIESCSRQSSRGLNGSMNLSKMDAVPSLPPSEAEHVLGNLGVQQLGVLQAPSLEEPISVMALNHGANPSMILALNPTLQNPLSS